MPPHTNFPLRWESTGEQWWFASPIDWAAANGHYDLVRELLNIDANLLIKLTSLRRIRRLETVWDDEDKEKFSDISKCRSQVAQKLLQECEKKKGYNSFIRAGYGGWLLYTAASAGDLMFVKQILDRDPLLVFGQGEYGITDLFYAAARGKTCDVFRQLLDSALSPKGHQQIETSSILKYEMMNRAVHAAARGGNIDVLKMLLKDCSDVLAYTDAQGSTLLHTASGRGQVEVVQYLISCYSIIACTVDNGGNTALHVAAYHGYLSVIEFLTSASPSIAMMTNKYGDTFLHMAVAGFGMSSFKRLDRQMELIRQLVAGKTIDINSIINSPNHEGKTALHVAVMANIQSNVVELIMSVHGIDLNIRDAEGNTPLDLLKQRPRSASSEVLIKLLVSAGGVSNCQDKVVRNAFVSPARARVIGVSPGTSFRIPDAELILQAGVEVCHASGNFRSNECTYSGEIHVMESPVESKHKRSSSISSAARRLKVLLRWPQKDTNAEITDSEDNWSIKSYRVCSTTTNSPLSLREQFSRPSSTPTNKRILSLQGNLPSPSTKKKVSASLTPSVRQVLPKSNLGSPLSTYSESSWASPMSTDIRHSRNVDSCSGSVEPSSLNQSPNLEKCGKKHHSLNLKLINKLFSFGRSRPGCIRPPS